MLYISKLTIMPEFLGHKPFLLAHWPLYGPWTIMKRQVTVYLPNRNNLNLYKIKNFH